MPRLRPFEPNPVGTAAGRSERASGCAGTGLGASGSDTCGDDRRAIRSPRPYRRGRSPARRRHVDGRGRRRDDNRRRWLRRDRCRRRRRLGRRVGFQPGARRGSAPEPKRGQQERPEECGEDSIWPHLGPPNVQLSMMAGKVASHKSSLPTPVLPFPIGLVREPASGGFSGCYSEDQTYSSLRAAASRRSMRSSRSASGRNQRSAIAVGTTADKTTTVTSSENCALSIMPALSP
jgi:hypothetical protein